MKQIHAHSVLAFWAGDDSLFERRQQKIIAVLRASRKPLTDREIMIRCGFSEPNQVRPRITQLVKLEVIAEVGKTECPITRKTVRLVRLVRREAQADFELREVLTPEVVATLSERSA